MCWVIVLLAGPLPAGADALAPPLAETRTTYYVTDAVGSVRGEVSEEGALTTTHRYTPFGLAPADALLTEDAPRFGSQLRLPATGTDDFHARHYQPDAGRFLSVDPRRGALSDPQTFNRYAFGLNHPLRYGDPTGAEAELVGTVGTTRFYIPHSKEDMVAIVPAFRDSILYDENTYQRFSQGGFGLDEPACQVVQQLLDELQYLQTCNAMSAYLLNRGVSVFFLNRWFLLANFYDDVTGFAGDGHALVAIDPADVQYPYARDHYTHVRTIVHEIAHGVTSPYATRLQSAHYTMGLQLQESLTEAVTDLALHGEVAKLHVYGRPLDQVLIDQYYEWNYDPDFLKLLGRTVDTETQEYYGYGQDVIMSTLDAILAHEGLSCSYQPCY